MVVIGLFNSAFLVAQGNVTDVELRTLLAEIRNIEDNAQVIRLIPNHASAFHNRGLAFYSMGNLDQAVADFTEVIRLDPDHEAARASIEYILQLEIYRRLKWRK